MQLPTIPSLYLTLAKWALIGCAVLYGWHSFQEWREREREAAQRQLSEAITAQTLQSQLTQVQRDLKDEQARASVLAQQLDKARADAQRRTEVFNRHRFGELVQAKPGLIEKRINDATAQVWQQIEQEANQ